MCFGGGLDIINLSAGCSPAPVMIITQSSPFFFLSKIRLLLLSNVNGLQAKYIAEEGSCVWSYKIDSREKNGTV